MFMMVTMGVTFLFDTTKHLCVFGRDRHGADGNRENGRNDELHIDKTIFSMDFFAAVLQRLGKIALYLAIWKWDFSVRPLPAIYHIHPRFV
jgi:hypothetical protein